MIVVCVILSILLCLIALRLTQIFALLSNRDVDHAKCISHIAHYTGNEFAAKVLEAAAEDYGSAEGQHQLAVIIQRVGRDRTIDAPPIPAIWMQDRAKDLRDEVKS